MADDTQRLVVALEAKIDKFEKSMAKAVGVTNKRAKEVETRFAKMNSKLATLGRNTLTPFITSAVAALAPVAALNTALETISDASNLAKAADRAGFATDAFQQLQYGFGLAGVEANQFGAGMEKFSKRIAEAAANGGTLAEILKANGIALRDTAGNIRGSVSLLTDYADLVKNAASEQERMFLATQAFDEGGAAFILALRNGRDGIDGMKKAADDAGGVLDEKLLRKAEEIDDRFAAMSRTIGINVKGAILSLAVAAEDAFDRIAQAADSSGFFQTIRALDKQQTGIAAGAAFGANAGKTLPTPTPVDPVEQARIASRISGAFTAPVAGAKPTVIPSKDRQDAIDAANREAEAVLKVIENLEFEKSQIGKTALAQEQANAVRSAGAAATDEQKAKIEALVEAIYTETEATKQAAEAQAELRALGKDVLGGFISDLRSSTSAAEALQNALNKVLDRLVEMALNNAFGSASGGIFGAIGSLFGFADGGIASRGRPMPIKTYARGGVAKSASVFGEAGPEAAVPLPDGRRIPVDLRVPQGGKGGQGAIAIQLSPDLEARILKQAEGQSIKVVSGATPGIVKSAKNETIRSFTNGGDGEKMMRGNYQVSTRSRRAV